MPIPGQQQNERLIHRAGERWKLGACRDDPPPPHGVIGTNNTIKLTISGLTDILSPALADADGAMPNLLGNPNETIILQPYLYASDTQGDARLWTGRAGSVNSHGCREGTIHTHEARAGIDKNYSAITIKVYILIVDQAGVCSYVQYVATGYPFFSELTRPGTRLTLRNVMGSGPIPSPIFSQVGHVIVEAAT